MTARDEFAERVVLGSCLAAGTVPADVRALTTPTDFWTPTHAEVAEAAWDLTDRAAPCDPVSVRTELLRRGSRSEATDGAWLVDLTSAAVPGSASYHARTVRDLAVRRQVVLEATRAVQAAENPACDPYDVAASLSAHALVLAERDDPARTVPVTTGQEFAMGPTDYDWLVPGLLERGDRLLVTGGEGSGKAFSPVRWPSRSRRVCIPSPALGSSRNPSCSSTWRTAPDTYAGPSDRCWSTPR